MARFELGGVESDVQSLFYAPCRVGGPIETITMTNAPVLTTIRHRPEIGLRRAPGASRTTSPGRSRSRRPSPGRLIGLTAVIAAYLRSASSTATMATRGRSGYLPTNTPTSLPIRPARLARRSSSVAERGSMMCLSASGRMRRSSNLPTSSVCLSTSSRTCFVSHPDGLPDLFSTANWDGSRFQLCCGIQAYGS